MELNRFKQLLEATMGNVKPLIVEEDIKYRGIGQDETSEQKWTYKEEYAQYIISRINRELNEKYPSSSTYNGGILEFTKPNVFFMDIHLSRSYKRGGSEFSKVVYTVYDKTTMNKIKDIMTGYGNIFDLNPTITTSKKDDYNSRNTGNTKVFYLYYGFLNPQNSSDNVFYPEDKEKKFETFWAWWFDIIYKSITELTSKIYNLGGENKQQSTVTTTTTTVAPGVSQQPTSTETQQGG
jgi:hypothetical protein